jgi:hypothetical protein
MARSVHLTAIEPGSGKSVVALGMMESLSRLAGWASSAPARLAARAQRAARRRPGGHRRRPRGWPLAGAPPPRDPLLDAVDLHGAHGAHDFRHTFATWLEDAGIPARVIDELMGHEASGRTRQHHGSAMSAHYRHTTPEMASRVATAVQERLTVVLRVAEQTLETRPNRTPLVFY